MMNNAVVTDFVKAINDGDVNRIYELMTEDHAFIDAQDHVHKGREFMKNAWKEYFEMFPDYQIDITEIIGTDTLFALFGYVSGTYKNLKNKDNSNYWRIPGSWKAIVADKKIRHWQVYCDYTGIMEIVNRNL